MLRYATLDNYKNYYCCSCSYNYNYAALRYTTLLAARYNYEYNYTSFAEHYTKLIAVHYVTFHDISLHYTTATTAPATTSTSTTKLHYPTLTTLHYTNHTTLYYTIYTTLHYTALQYETLQYTTVHCAIRTTSQPQPQLQLQLRSANNTTLQLQLTTTIAIHYNYNYSYNCTPPRYIQKLWWGEHCKHCNHSKQHNSNTFRFISGFALPSVVHNNQPPLQVFYFWNFCHRLARHYW